MPDINYNIDFFAIFILLGIGQALFIAIILLFNKKNRNKANIFLSLFLVVIALILMDIFLCYTRLVLNAIFLFNFSGPLIFLIGPLIYLYFKHLIGTGKTKILVHLLLFILYFGYSFFFLIQNNEIKYNIYVYWYNIDLPPIGITGKMLDDPLHIKSYYIPAALIHLCFYFIITLVLVYKYFLNNKYRFFGCESDQTRWIRDFLLMCFLSILITTVIKFTVNLSTHNYLLAVYLSIYIYFISFRLAFNPDLINLSKRSSYIKFQKSSLSDDMKQELLQRIKSAFEKENIYRDNLLTLAKLSEKISASPNHISQVINECLNKNFYELLSDYRIKEAAELLIKHKNYTIDQIAFEVGYNSRTAFNNAFKKTIGKTPSEYINSFK